MRDSVLTERLQPSLLDRLVDDAPGETVESRDRRTISIRQLREAVRRDLNWLFNAKSLPIDHPGWQYEHVRQSVVNFGMPDLAGVPTSANRARRIQASMRSAVEWFEPRIVASTLEVSTFIDTREGVLDNVYVTEIRAEACPVPVPEPLFVRAKVDVETGECEVQGRWNG